MVGALNIMGSFFFSFFSHSSSTLEQGTPVLFTQTNTLKFRPTVLLYYNLLYLAKHQLTEESSNILQGSIKEDGGYDGANLSKIGTSC